MDNDNRRFFAAVVGLALGYIIGEHSETVAKLILFFSRNGSYESWRVAETSLVIMIIFIGLAMYFGRRASKLGLATDEDIILTLVSGLIVALFAIVNNSLPEPTISSGSPLSTGVYLIGWAIGLWLMPMFFLPNPERSYELWLQRGIRLAVLTVTISVIFLVSGLVIAEIFQSYLPELFPNVFRSDSPCVPCRDRLDFWLIRPPIIHPILAALLLVILVPFWWEELWSKKDSPLAKYWWLCGSLMTITVYAGLIGVPTYLVDEFWARKLVDDSPLSILPFVVLIGGFPIIGFTVVLISYLLSRHVRSNTSGMFWWFLSPGFALGFLIIAVVGVAPIYRLAEASTEQLAMMYMGYGISGAVFGALLPVFKWLKVRLFEI